MLGLRPKVRVGDAQVMVSVELEQSLSILVHFTHAELFKAGVPRVVTTLALTSSTRTHNK